MAIYKDDNFGDIAKSGAKSPSAPRGGKGVMDFRPSQGLASGLKRIGGRSGISRLGRATSDAMKHGKIRISHKY